MTTVASATRHDPTSSLEHLCIEVGGSFEFNTDGECELLYDDRLPVMIRREEDDAITLAACVAHHVTADETTFLSRLMAYQWMGRNTNGFLLSWNDVAETVVLSHRVDCVCRMQDLKEPLERLLMTVRDIQHDIHALLEAGDDRVPRTLDGTEPLAASHLKA
jgi:hypothetical protein